jgi:hypothetical protein
MPVSSPVAGKIPVVRLLPHVVEATAHAGQLDAAPGPSVRVLSRVVLELVDAGQLDISRLLLDRALRIAAAAPVRTHDQALLIRSGTGRAARRQARASGFSRGHRRKRSLLDRLECPQEYDRRSPAASEFRTSLRGGPTNHRNIRPP